MLNVTTSNCGNDTENCKLINKFLHMVLVSRKTVWFPESGKGGETKLIQFAGKTAMHSKNS